MNKWIKAVLILAIGALIAWGVHTERTKEFADWVSTDNAVVTNIVEYRDTSRRSHSGRSHRIDYTYIADGISYSGDDLYGGSTDIGVGQDATVWYDPDDPQTSSFHKPAPEFNSVVPLWIAVLLALRTLIWKEKISWSQTQKGSDNLG